MSDTGVSIYAVNWDQYQWQEPPPPGPANADI